MLSVNPLYLMKHRVRQTGFNWSKTALVVGILIIWPVLGSSLRAGPNGSKPGTQGLAGGVQICCQDGETRSGQCFRGQDSGPSDSA